MEPDSPRNARYRSAGYDDTVARIATNVRRLRTARGRTQEEVAYAAARLSPRLYRQIEAGKTNLTAATLTRIAEALGVDVAALLVPAEPTPSKRGRPRKLPRGEASAAPEAMTIPGDDRNLPPAKHAIEATRSAPHLSKSRMNGVFLDDEQIPQDGGGVRAGSAALPASELDRPSLPPHLMPMIEAAQSEDVVTEATRLAQRLDELRLELTERHQRLVEEAARVDGALAHLTETSRYRLEGDALPVAPRVVATALVIPPIVPEHGVRRAVVVLLQANPGGLRVTELAQAIGTSRLRPKKNELHNEVRSLFESGVVTRDGFRGGYVYRLRAGTEPGGGRA